jgi:hypothetical protein
MRVPVVINSATPAPKTLRTITPSAFPPVPPGTGKATSVVRHGADSQSLGVPGADCR